MSHLKFTNSHSWQIPVAVWLLLEQSDSLVHDKKNIYTIWEYTVYQNVSWILLLHLNLSFLSLP